MKKTISLCLLIFFHLFFVKIGYAQDATLGYIFAESPEEKKPVEAIFKTTQLVNLRTVEQVKQGELDFRVAHRFGNMAGEFGGIETMFGIENVSDLRLAFDYGVTDRICVGIGRTKGAGTLRQLFDANFKLKMLQQTKGKSPFTVSLYGIALWSAMKSSTDTFAVTYFEKFAHRVQYATQILIARKFSRSFSLQIAPSLVHRNKVLYDDQNTTFGVAIGGRLKFTKRMGIIADYAYMYHPKQAKQNSGLYLPLGVGIEMETGGHVFHVLFSNNPALTEPQYLTDTKETWTNGGFRVGFNISRVFNVYNPKH